MLCTEAYRADLNAVYIEYRIDRLLSAHASPTTYAGYAMDTRAELVRQIVPQPAGCQDETQPHVGTREFPLVGKTISVTNINVCTTSRVLVTSRGVSRLMQSGPDTHQTTIIVPYCVLVFTKSGKWYLRYGAMLTLIDAMWAPVDHTKIHTTSAQCMQHMPRSPLCVAWITQDEGPFMARPFKIPHLHPHPPHSHCLYPE